MKLFPQVSLWLFFVIALLGCKPDYNEALSNTLVVRITADLKGLNPVLYRAGSSTRLMNLLIPTIVDFDPKTLAFAPVLIDSLPKEVVLPGENSDKVAYRFRFRKEAKWPDGSSITAKDYIFSLKVAFNRKIRGNSWTRVLSIIDKVITNPDDPKECTVVLKKKLANSLGYFAGFELLPEYHYDPNHLLAAFPLDDFVSIERFDKLWTAHPEITQFAQQFSQEKYIREPDGVVGAGPYRLAKWEVNDQIVLVKRKNYWADQLSPPSTLLVGYPDTIVYKIVADEVATKLKIKNKELDLVSNLSASDFIKFKKDPIIRENYNFFTPISQEFYVVILNTKSPKLDNNVRIALAKSIDVNQILEATVSGLGKRIISPLSPNSPYYHHGLEPIKKDIQAAKELLAQAGWRDNDHDGILEKEIHGKVVPLELTMVAGGTSPIGMSSAPIIKAEAAKVGIKVNILGTTNSEILSKLRSPKFEMALVRFITSPTDYMPYGSWHSDNAGLKGKNYSRYSSTEMDAIIDSLQMSQKQEEKKKAYLRFQENLYENQPVIFLFSPDKTIIVQKRWEPLITPIRPNFFENSFRLKKN